LNVRRQNLARIAVVADNYILFHLVRAAAQYDHWPVMVDTIQ